RGRRGGIGGRRPSLAGPARDTAIEDAHVRMPEVFEKPERPCGAQARIALVDDDRTLGRHAAQRELVTDHPHERAERRLARVDQAHAPEVEMHRALDLAPRELVRGPRVDEKRRPIALERAGQVVRRDEKIAHTHRNAYLRTKSAANTYASAS